MLDEQLAHIKESDRLRPRTSEKVASIFNRYLEWFSCQRLRS